MSRIKSLATVSLMAICLAAPAYAGSVTTFATTTDVASDDITWTDNGTSGLLNTANTTTGNQVTFQYLHIAGLSSSLTGSLNAYELINGGAGVATTDEATQSPDGTTDTQVINSAFTISYALATPIKSGNVFLSNLLTATITPEKSGGSLAGTDGGSAATYSASTNTKNFYLVTFTSDFLKFTTGSTFSVSLAFNSVTPQFTLDEAGAFVSSFTADLVGSFAASPVPTAIPEVPSAALLIIGMAAVGVGARRRAAKNA